MEISSAIPPGIKFGVIGLGQCGGNITEEFYRRGYPGITMNTSYTDLRGGYLPAVKRFHVGTQGHDGAGQDMELGGKYLLANSKRILETVNREFGDAEMLLLVSGLGGGTGSNLNVLAKILEELDIPMSALVSLPLASEGSIKKINAMRGLNDLLSSPVKSIALIDNQKIFTMLPEVELSNLYREANGFVVSIFDRINRLTRHPGFTPVRNFDSEDLRRFFNTEGIMLFGETELTERDFKDETGLSTKLSEIWDKGGLLSSGFDYSEASMVAAVLTGPASMLKSASLSRFERFTAGIKDLINSGGIYTGIFQVPEGREASMLTIVAGLTIPDRVNEILEEAKSEGKMLSMKISHTIEDLDLGDLEDVEFFPKGRKLSPETVFNEGGEDTEMKEDENFKIEPWSGESEN